MSLQHVAETQLMTIFPLSGAVSSAAEASRSLRELATGPDYIKQCLPVDLLTLLEGRPLQRKVLKSGCDRSTGLI